MLKLFLIPAFITAGYVVSIYSLSVPDTNSGTIQFNSFQGKKILLVNTATGVASANQQFSELQQFYQQHHDSVEVIIFPSNSFGNESRSNAEIKTFLQDNYGVSFLIAAKSWVRGDSANTVYQWLGSKLQNDVMEARTKRDFQKYLIDASGKIVAKFDSSISVNSSAVLGAIMNN